MAKRAALVSVHSRKGGVGKTSIVMSSAIQLAAQGKKVAVLDLDTHGAHLSQSLPLKGDLRKEEGGLCFDPKSARVGNYSTKGYLAGRFSGKMERLEDLAQQLVSDDSVLSAVSTTGLQSELKSLDENLYLFPMSPYIRDVDGLNDLTLKKSGQDLYRQVLSKLFEELDQHSYDYIIVDNSPGLSLNPGLTLQAALEEGRQRNVQSWFVSNAPWWEQGLIVYELNVFKTYLEDMKVTTTLIVNRVGEEWLGDSKFHVGERWVVKRNTEQFQKVVERLFCIPMWMVADQDTDRLANKFLLPERFGISVLGDDDTIRKAQTTDGDYRSAGVAPSDLENSLTHDCRRDFVILAMRYLQFFALPALRALQKGMKAIETTEHKNGSTNGYLFHQSVNSALVRPLVSSGE